MRVWYIENCRALIIKRNYVKKLLKEFKCKVIPRIVNIILTKVEIYMSYMDMNFQSSRHEENLKLI